jgi:hypothetical protein
MMCAEVQQFWAQAARMLLFRAGRGSDEDHAKIRYSTGVVYCAVEGGIRSARSVAQPEESVSGGIADCLTMANAGDRENGIGAVQPLIGVQDAGGL